MLAGSSSGVLEAYDAACTNRCLLEAFNILKDLSKYELLKDWASRGSVHLSHIASSGQMSRVSIVGDSGSGPPTMAGLVPGLLGDMTCG